MSLERLNNLPLNTVTLNFVAIFVFFGTASSFIERISFSEIEVKQEAFLFLFGCSEVNSTWIITSGLAEQRVPKALFTKVWYILIHHIPHTSHESFIKTFLTTPSQAKSILIETNITYREFI